MRDAEYALVQMIRSRREGSTDTQKARRQTARQFIRTLAENGYSRDTRKRDFAIKERHVLRAVKVWREGGISDRVIANRLSHIRRFCEYQGRPGMVKASNDFYLPGRDKNRVRGPGEALPSVSPGDVNREAAETPWARASLGLQAEFGLRRKEALKVVPSQSPADNSRLVLHRTATKGGRSREIEARTPSQRDALAYAKDVAGTGSLVPPGRTYTSWREAYRKEAQRAGVPNGSTHGIRRGYAQERHAEAAGHPGPYRGGKWKLDMTPAEKIADGAARDLVSDELGHGRRGVVAHYVGGAKAPEGSDNG